MKTLIIKNQKLEIQVQENLKVMSDYEDLKAQRDKQQAEFKQLYLDKQKMYEDIIKLNEQVSSAKLETKEKILAIAYVEKEKNQLQKQIENY